jgi:hypothetical protein
MDESGLGPIVECVNLKVDLPGSEDIVSIQERNVPACREPEPMIPGCGGPAMFLPHVSNSGIPEFAAEFDLVG